MVSEKKSIPSRKGKNGKGSKKRLSCPVCSASILKSSLESHVDRKHPGKVSEKKLRRLLEGGRDPRRRVPRKRAVMIGAVFLVVLVAGVSIYAALNRPVEQAQDFTLTSIDGQQFSLRQFEGQPIILDFMFVDCGTCRAQMEELKDAYDEYAGAGLVIISINTVLSDSDDRLDAYRADFGLSESDSQWIFARDTEEVASLYANNPDSDTERAGQHGTSNPYLLLLDRDQAIVEKYVGLTNYEDEIRPDLVETI